MTSAEPTPVRPPERLADRDIPVETLVPATEALPDHARVVIVGGGIIGSSIAWHLAQLGVRDIVLVERGRLTNGTTWHAAGLVSRVRGSHALTALTEGNVAAYRRVAADSGIDIGLREVGALTVARTAGRMQEILGGVSMARDHDIPVEVVDPERIGELWPAARTHDLVGGVLFPSDATVDPGWAAVAFARAAVLGGAVRYVPGVEVTGFRGSRSRVTGLETTRGPIDADVVVLAAGLWTSELARRAGASVALHPAEHVWVMTEPTGTPTTDLPFLRDLDGYLYIRGYRDRFVVGAFEPDGRPLDPSRVSTSGYAELGPDWDHLAPVLADARARVPALEGLGFAHFLRAPESFTPDSNFQLGFVPEVDGLFVAAGLNSQGIIFGPGVGRAAAAWITAGHMTQDLVEVDVARMGAWAHNRRWLRERTVESLGALYAMHWPGYQPVTARGLRRLPLDAAYRAAGAAMGQVGGWERPMWFEPGCVDPPFGYDQIEPSWFPAVREEVRATREGVALYDLTTYAKFEVAGPGALAGLQALATSDLDVPVGRVVYTILENERGGIELDPTITRLADARFLVLAPTVTQRSTGALLRRRLPADTVVTDVTSAWSTLHLAGPRSRDLLARLTDADVSPEGWPFLRARELEVGRTAGWGFRVSFTGELGWELMVPTETVVDLYEHVLAAGSELGLRHAGAFAFEACRLERGFRSWGHDIGPLDDPVAAGLGFAVAPDRRGAAPGVSDRRLVSVHAPNAVLWHGESLLRDGERVGFLTSASIAPTLGGSVGLAWISGPLEGAWQVQVRGALVACRVSREPFYDPRGARLHG